MNAVQITQDTLAPLKRGHPWVYTSGLRTRAASGAGTPVQLVDHRGKGVAFGLADDGPIAVRVLGRHPEPVPALIRRRLSAAADARPNLIPADTNAYRVVNGEGDGLGGLIVDRYDDTMVLRLYSAAWVPHLDAIVSCLQDRPETVTVLRRYGVRRVDGRDGAETLHGPEAREPIVVREAGLPVHRPPNHRPEDGSLPRPARAPHPHGQSLRRVNGRQSVCLQRRILRPRGRGGCEACDQRRYRAGCPRRRTGELPPQWPDPTAHSFVAEDVFKWSPDVQADAVICDPPSLTHGKSADANARRVYRDLAQRSANMVRPGGLLASASCTARLSWERWEQAVREGVGKTGRWSWLWRAAEPPDHPVALGHPEGRYLKFALLRRHPARFP